MPTLPTPDELDRLRVAALRDDAAHYRSVAVAWEPTPDELLMLYALERLLKSDGFGAHALGWDRVAWNGRCAHLAAQGLSLLADRIEQRLLTPAEPPAAAP